MMRRPSQLNLTRKKILGDQRDKVLFQQDQGLKSDNGANASPSLTTRPSPHSYKVSQETLRAVAVKKGLTPKATTSQADNRFYAESTPEASFNLDSESGSESGSESALNPSREVREYAPKSEDYESQSANIRPTEPRDLGESFQGEDKTAFWIGEGFWIVANAEGALLAVNQQKLLVSYLQLLMDKNQECKNKPLLFPMKVPLEKK